MTAFLILCAVYCTVRGAWVVGVECFDAVVEIGRVIHAAARQGKP